MPDAAKEGAMPYASYDFYRTAFLGRAVTQEDFPRLALRASAYLDSCTQGRAAGNAHLTAVQMACCALAECCQRIEAAQALAQAQLAPAGALRSETVGAWSRSYAGGAEAAAALQAGGAAQRDLAATARRYLAGTGLLYRGCGRCCRCSPTP